MGDLLKTSLEHASGWSALMFCSFCLTVLGIRAIDAWTKVQYMFFSKSADPGQLAHAAAALGIRIKVPPAVPTEPGDTKEKE